MDTMDEFDQFVLHGEMKKHVNAELIALEDGARTSLTVAHDNADEPNILVDETEENTISIDEVY